jgi:hypothetical protein
VLGQAVLNGAHSALDAQVAAALAAAGSGSAAQAPADAASIALTYQPDPRLSDWTRASMIDSLSRGDAGLRQQLERAFAGNTVLEGFDRFMALRGYSSRDVADDVAELLLVSWHIATESTATQAQIRGVHQQTHSAFSADPQLRSMADADRQLMAERVAYEVMISFSADNELQRSGTAAQRLQLQQSAAATTRELGVDLSRLHLTDQGFSQ